MNDKIKKFVFDSNYSMTLGYSCGLVSLLLYFISYFLWTDVNDGYEYIYNSNFGSKVFKNYQVPSILIIIASILMLVLVFFIAIRLAKENVYQIVGSTLLGLSQFLILLSSFVSLIVLNKYYGQLITTPSKMFVVELFSYIKYFSMAMMFVSFLVLAIGFFIYRHEDLLGKIGNSLGIIGSGIFTLWFLISSVLPHTNSMMTHFYNNNSIPYNEVYPFLNCFTKGNNHVLQVVFSDAISNQGINNQAREFAFSAFFGSGLSYLYLVALVADFYFILSLFIKTFDLNRNSKTI